MKAKVLKSVKYVTLFLLLLLLGHSCSDDDPVTYYEETQWNIESFTVEASEWNWNFDLARWEAVKQLKYIDEFIYESGAVIGYLCILENGSGVQYQLPHTVNIVVGDERFTETLDYNFDFKTNRVTFLIKPSDSIDDLEARQTYDFRIAMIW